MKKQQNKIENWEKELKYNAHDLGEFGHFIMLEYAGNIIRGLQSKNKEWKRELKEKIKKMKFRKVIGGYKREKENGIVTNLEYCEGFNQAIDEILDLFN